MTKLREVIFLQTLKQRLSSFKRMAMDFQIFFGYNPASLPGRISRVEKYQNFNN